MKIRVEITPARAVAGANSKNAVGVLNHQVLSFLVKNSIVRFQANSAAGLL